MQPKHKSSRVHSSRFTVSGGFRSPLTSEYKIVELFLVGLTWNTEPLGKKPVLAVLESLGTETLGEIRPSVS